MNLSAGLSSGADLLIVMRANDDRRTSFGGEGRCESAPPHLLLKVAYPSFPQFLAAQESLRQRRLLICPRLAQIEEVLPSEEPLSLSLKVLDPGPNDFSPGLTLREKALAFRHCLEALATLQAARRTHGDIRPKFIHFSREKRRGILLERLGDTLPALQRQVANFEAGEKLYQPFEVVENLRAGRAELLLSPFKTDLFCLAMAVLESLGPEMELQELYRGERQPLARLREMVSTKVGRSKDPEERALLVFLSEFVFCERESERPGATDALVRLLGVMELQGVWAEETGFCESSRFLKGLSELRSRETSDRNIPRASQATEEKSNFSLNKSFDHGDYFRSIGIRVDEDRHLAFSQQFSQPPSMIFAKNPLPYMEQVDPAGRNTLCLDLNASLAKETETFAQANKAGTPGPLPLVNLLDDFIFITEPRQPPPSLRPASNGSENSTAIKKRNFEVSKTLHFARLPSVRSQERISNEPAFLLEENSKNATESLISLDVLLKDTQPTPQPSPQASPRVPHVTKNLDRQIVRRVFTKAIEGLRGSSKSKAEPPRQATPCQSLYSEPIRIPFERSPFERISERSLPPDYVASPLFSSPLFSSPLFSSQRPELPRVLQSERASLQNLPQRLTPTVSPVTFLNAKFSPLPFQVLPRNLTPPPRQFDLPPKRISNFEPKIPSQLSAFQDAPQNPKSFRKIDRREKPGLEIPHKLLSATTLDSIRTIQPASPQYTAAYFAPLTHSSLRPVVFNNHSKELKFTY